MQQASVLEPEAGTVEHGYYEKECILGIALGSEHKEAAEQMFRYLLEKSNLD